MTSELLLQQIGLTDKEAKVYLAILELGSSTVKPIADRAGVKRTSVYNFIDRLIELGLVTQAELRGRMRYQAVSPTYLADLQRERLRLVEENLPNFLSIFNASAQKPRIHYYEGKAQVKQAIYEEIHCKKETAFFLPATDIMEMIGIDTMEDVNKKRVANGIRGRSLRVRDKAVPFPTSARSKQNLLDVRIAPSNFNFSMGIGLYDTGKVGFFSSKNEGFAIMIESLELYQVMKGFYEMAWGISEPLREGQG